MKWVRLGSGLLVAVVFSGCAAGVRAPAEFVGSPAPALAPSAVRQVDVLPAGYHRIGKVRSECVPVARLAEVSAAWLSDIDCTVQRLEQALRERAAEAGVDLLVRTRCASQLERRSPRRVRVSCTADVARASDEARERLPFARSEPGQPSSPPGIDAASAARLDEPTGTQAWRIRLKFSPAPSAPRRAPRHTDTVRQHAVMPVGHLSLGDLIAVCKEGCTREAVHAAVRVAAGRVGASDVVGIGCARRGEGWLCSGTAAAYVIEREVDLRTP